MFEKKAEEYGLENYRSYDDYPYVLTDEKAITKAFKDGAEFGYNKVDEEAKNIINELLMDGYDENTREKALNFLYPDKE